MPKRPVEYITIPLEFADQRIDNYLVTRLKNVPKTHIYRILRKGEVRVNKKRIAPSYRLQDGDVLRLPPLEMAEKPRLTANSRVIALLKQRILYEDDYLMIINKPSGMAVHSGSGVKMGVVEALRDAFPKLVNLELVHRLDRETSGCLVLAKKRSILKELHRLWREGKIRKIYHTLTKGHWQTAELRVDVSLEKNILSNGERIVKVAEEGKPSLTVFSPIQVFNQASFMEALLETGRMHQIRVHAKYRGHPIAGDEKYKDAAFNKAMRTFGVNRLFLHAYSLEFHLPSMNKHIKVIAPLDQDLLKTLAALA